MWYCTFVFALVANACLLVGTEGCEFMCVGSCKQFRSVVFLDLQFAFQGRVLHLKPELADFCSLFSLLQGSPVSPKIWD